MTTKHLSEVCHDVQVEPTLLLLTRERMEHRAAIENNEARLDIRARVFWIRRPQTFLDIRVFDPNACRYSNSSLSQCYTTNDKEKKRNYNQCIMQVKQGTFSPLVFSIYGGMVRAFYSKLSALVAAKRDIHKSVMMHWIRSKLCYALLKSCLLCLRGSRTRNHNITKVEQDIAAQYERHFKTRIEEHIKKYNKSHTFKHLHPTATCFDSYNSLSFRISDKANSKFDLKIKEALHINWRKPNLNAQQNHLACTLSL